MTQPRSNRSIPNLSWSAMPLLLPALWGLAGSGCQEATSSGPDSPRGGDASIGQGGNAGASSVGGATVGGATNSNAGATNAQEAAVTARVEEILSKMTLEQKTAQMTQIQFEDVSTAGARAECYGSIFNGGEELPFTNDPATWAQNLDALQQATIDGCGIPMLYAIDAVHGNAKVIGSTVFPHEVGLGATGDADLLARIGKAVGEECRGAGIHWVFAPTLAVARDERWGRTYESFGETPELNAKLGAAYIKGLQGGGDLSDPGAVAATAKHYVGDGATKGGINAGIVEVGEATIRAIHLPPYQAAIAQNVATVMPSYHQWRRDGLLHYMSTDDFALNGLLKNELGFKGLCISDYDAIPRTGGTAADGSQLPYSQDSVAASVNAGMDMAMVAMKGGVSDWLRFLRSGVIPQARIDDAVRRILRIKVMMGLFDDNFSKAKSNATLRSQIWSQAHQDLAREAVQKSLVLLKNDKILPLSKQQAIKVVGSYADSMGAQAGGWTVSWQGSDKYGNSEVMGETILAGLRALDSNVEYNSTIAAGDVVIAVVGERPSAEEYGDDGHKARDTNTWASVRLQKQPGYTELQAALTAGAKVILVIMSGRPLIIEDPTVIEKCSAIVEAWLPGSRGIGVADVLFGDVNFSGKLPHTWPRTFEQIPVNVNKQSDEPGYDAASTDVLYPYGYGLSY